MTGRREAAGPDVDSGGAERAVSSARVNLEYFDRAAQRGRWRCWAWGSFILESFLLFKFNKNSGRVCKKKGGEPKK